MAPLQVGQRLYPSQCQYRPLPQRRQQLPQPLCHSKHHLHPVQPQQRNERRLHQPLGEGGLLRLLLPEPRQRRHHTLQVVLSGRSRLRLEHRPCRKLHDAGSGGQAVLPERTLRTRCRQVLPHQEYRLFEICHRECRRKRPHLRRQGCRQALAILDTRAVRKPLVHSEPLYATIHHPAEWSFQQAIHHNHRQDKQLCHPKNRRRDTAELLYP